jgi:hypothetical protein
MGPFGLNGMTWQIALTVAVSAVGFLFYKLVKVRMVF